MTETEEGAGIPYLGIVSEGIVGQSQCLWPAPFDEDTPEAAWRFVLEQRSYIETTGQILAIPPNEYLEAYAHIWHECKGTRRMLATEKCRRMLVSWCARSLELHQLGLGRCDQILVGEDLDAAAKHVWRLKHLYVDLQLRHPEWNLPNHTELRYSGERKLKSFSLPNGSICNYANGESSGIQGDGTRIITMEEAGLYRYLAEMVAQAKILTIGPVSQRGGTLVNLITNTPPADAPSAMAWQRIKQGWRDVEPRRNLKAL